MDEEVDSCSVGVVVGVTMGGQWAGGRREEGKMGEGSGTALLGKVDGAVGRGAAGIEERCKASEEL